MSILLRNRSLLFALMLIGTAGIVSFGQQPRANSLSEGKCAEYHLLRVAFLLGCCGDLPIAYSGERFHSPLNRTQRATLALNEIDLAMRRPCPQDRSAARLDLLINRIGAYALRARDRAENATSLSDIDHGLHDAAVAAHELKAFAQAHPDAAVKIWPWIAMTFRRCGRPLEAIWFLNKVKEKCCHTDKTAEGNIARVKADTWFDLAMYGAAANGYSEWLSTADESALCGKISSLGNISELRRRGFKIGAHAVEGTSIGVCVPQSEWEPYAGIPK